MAATLAASSTPGSACTNASSCRCVTTSGGASRSTSGPAALTRKPASRQPASTCAATGSVRTTPSQRPTPRTSRDQRVRRAPSMPRAQVRAEPVGGLQQALAPRPSRSTASAAAQATGLPPKVVPWSPWRRRGGRRPVGDDGADRQAAAEALGERDDVGAHARGGDGAGQPARRPGRCRPAPRRGAAARRRRRRPPGPPRGSRRAARRRRPRPGPARARRAAVRAVDGGASAAASPYGTKVTGPGSGSKGARLAGCPVTASAPRVRPWKAPSAATQPPPGRSRREIFSAASLASAPELVNSTRLVGVPTSACSRSASCTRRVVRGEVAGVPERA